MAPVGANAWVRVAAGGLDWTSRLTKASADDLGLAAGTDVWIAVKSQAFRRLR